ncbi:MAG TPA: flagellin, partial [Acetobacteraceae bacterium]|nr:flagellin [Acetobacteraceae bacterium]
SWARDLMRGLGTLAALDPAQIALGADFQAVVATAREALRSAVEAMAQERGMLGAVERRLEAAREAHADLTVTLRLQLSSVEEVDAAETIARLQATRIQIESSYQALGMLGELSLARFLR